MQSRNRGVPRASVQRGDDGDECDPDGRGGVTPNRREGDLASQPPAIRDVRRPAQLVVADPVINFRERHVRPPRDRPARCGRGSLGDGASATVHGHVTWFAQSRRIPGDVKPISEIGQRFADRFPASARHRRSSLASIARRLPLYGATPDRAPTWVETTVKEPLSQRIERHNEGFG